MRLAFDPGQPHQLAAMTAIVEALAGARASSPAECTVAVDGVAVVQNRLAIPPEAFDESVRRIQRKRGLPESGVRWEAANLVIDGVVQQVSIPQLAVEMETGTGKTYVFLRTAFELARHRGLRKFVIVVPSVAIREGVLRTLQTTRTHLHTLYPELPYRFFAYDSRQLGPAVRFARSGTVDFAILTVDAFNRATNVFRQAQDRIGGSSLLRLWQCVHPVLLLDEPHHLETPLRVQALCDLHPCLAIRYGATHRREEGLVYRLSPKQAHTEGLVKTIEVVPSCGDIEDPAARFSAQLRAMIHAHLQRHEAFRQRRIKVLSLVFLERVADYAHDDGIVRRLFAQHFDNLKDAYPDFRDRAASDVCGAYFAHDRGRKAAPSDTRSGRSQKDAEAYNLILRDKERLLDVNEPVSFVFSHSALREGWDNPNVFQICTLAHSRSAIKKRQEIGRGIRLCVDETGRRVFDRDVNVLQVFANESYASYVGSLQAELTGLIPDDERAPLPRGPGAGPVEPPGASQVGHDEVPRPGTYGVNHAEAILRLHFADRTLPDRNTWSRTLPNLVDRVIEAVDPHVDVPPSRAAVLQILESIRPLEWLLVDPPWARRTRGHGHSPMHRSARIPHDMTPRR